ncbi:hypothetical protein V493_05227 [Pseudogymnoascus sp. VKM F-4281 (FW-2241)]|nr:hypothetical protein V493_05227 [Pseudogymnoascus sp. VKM F-4281 (FW-2241)]
MPLWEIQQEPTGREIKDLDPVVVATAYQTPGDGINMQRAHEDFVGVDDAEADAGVSVPYANHLIVARGGDEASVVAELGASKALGVAREFADAPPGVDVPEAHAEVAAAAYDDVVAQLDGVDGAGVAVEVAVERAGAAVDDGDGAVFGAGYDVLGVEGKVEDCGGVVGELADGEVGVGDGVDDAGSVRGAGDEDGGVVLKAED